MYRIFQKGLLLAILFPQTGNSFPVQTGMPAADPAYFGQKYSAPLVSVLLVSRFYRLFEAESAIDPIDIVNSWEPPETPDFSITEEDDFICSDYETVKSELGIPDDYSAPGAERLAVFAELQQSPANDLPAKLAIDPEDPFSDTQYTATVSNDTLSWIMLFIPESVQVKNIEAIPGILSCPTTSSETGNDQESQEEKTGCEPEEGHEPENPVKTVPNHANCMYIAIRVNHCKSPQEAREIADDIGQYDVAKLATFRAKDFAVKLMNDPDTSIRYSDLSLFWLACRQGFIDIVKALYHPSIDLKAFPRAMPPVYDDHKTALLIAVMGGHLDVVRYLLQQGADVSAKTKGGHTVEFLLGSVTDTELRGRLYEELTQARALRQRPAPYQVLYVYKDSPDKIEMVVLQNDIKLPPWLADARMNWPLTDPVVHAANMANHIAEQVFRKNIIPKAHAEELRVYINELEIPDESQYTRNIYASYFFCPETHKLRVVIETDYQSETVLLLRLLISRLIDWDNNQCISLSYFLKCRAPIRTPEK